MNNEFKEKDIKDLTEDEKKEISEYYYKNYSTVINALTYTIANIVAHNDKLGFAFLVDIIKVQLTYALNKLYNENNNPDDFKIYSQCRFLNRSFCTHKRIELV